MAVAGKAKNPKFGRATTCFFSSISGGKRLILTDWQFGNGLRLNVM